VTGAIAQLVLSSSFGPEFGLTLGASIVAGFLVGLGTSLGSGCTSGHGVCGLARTSRRSLVAVATFMAFGAATASIIEAVPALRDLVHGAAGEVVLSHYQIPYFGYVALALGVVMAIDGALLRPPKMPVVEMPSLPPSSAEGEIVTLDSLKEIEGREADAPEPPIERSSSSIKRAPSRASLSASWSALAVSWLVGALFAVGLLLGGMANPLKVVSFLTPAISTGWDPSLALVMAGALFVNFVAFPLIFRHPGPLLGDGNVWSLPGTTLIDWNLFGGAALFGTGWGIAGFCPGPALVNIATGKAHALVIIASLLLGMAVYKLATGQIKLHWFRSAASEDKGVTEPLKKKTNLTLSM
jgi:uncharacterized protein